MTGTLHTPAPRVYTDRKIGLGWTEEGYRVVAEITLEPSDRVTPSMPPIVTFQDHSQGPRPECVSVSFHVVGPGGANNRYESIGQIPAEERIVTKRHENDASPELAAFIEELWTAHHLNTTHAECIHMTESMLNPAPEIFDAYVAEHPESMRWGAGQALQSYRLDEVTCPETGYRYGHAWLAHTVPAEIIAEVRSIIATGKLAGE